MADKMNRTGTISADQLDTVDTINIAIGDISMNNVTSKTIDFQNRYGYFQLISSDSIKYLDRKVTLHIVK